MRRISSNTPITMQPFDPIHSVLRGKCLIEAGAGTGKTYTITTLTLRLILQEALTVEQILVVTFTTAATAELRDRLRRRLKTAHQAITGAAIDDPELDYLLTGCEDSRELLAERLEDALANFDCMPVYTIHGFCQRVLSEMAFETGSAFDAELVTDTSAIVQRLADDFWRQTWSTSSPELLRFALPKMKSPDHLAMLYRRYALPLLELCPDEPVSPPPSFDTFRDQWMRLRQQWRQWRDEILPLLASPDLNAISYGSLKASSGSGKFQTKRETKLQALRNMLDQWLRCSTGGFPLPEELVYMTRSKLHAATKKGGHTPQHSFFEACDRIWEEGRRLERAMQVWLTGIYVHFFHFMAVGLGRAKQEKQVLFFDDLLMMVHGALHRERDGALKRMLGQRYRAVLIDEFQDTDAIQYDIFNALFGSGNHLMFMIGDPKQAIYSFRGADIFTYLHAAQGADRRYTLTQNWRSTPHMVEAVNTLFAYCPRPFLWPEIAYHRATAAKTASSTLSLVKRHAPLTVWFLDNPKVTPRRRAFNKQTAAERALKAVVGEIRELAWGSSTGKGAVPLSDMAILVRTNRQAGEVKHCLSAAAIPAVIYNAGSVFHQPEALDLRRVLDAVADPGNEKKLRTALATPIFGRRGNELDFDDEAPDWWGSLIDRFFIYRQLWQRDGFIRMLRQVVVQEKIASRLLSNPGGERYYTNILHLMELLHGISVERGLGLLELIQWLDDRRMTENDTAEAHQIRLESDSQAVTIMTVHKSKGLEFPVVFCPFSWEGPASPNPPALCHQNDRRGYRLLDMGSDAIDKHLAKMAEEQRAEEIRLLYVAVTRAKKRFYLAWGPLPSSENSALAYLVYGVWKSGPRDASQEEFQAIARAFKNDDGDAHRQASEALAGLSNETIAVVDMPDEGHPHFSAAVPPVSGHEARQFQRDPMPVWKIASFSSLVSKRPDHGEILDRDMDREEVHADIPQATARQEYSRTIGEMALFEAGPRAGVFLHDILENIDFTASDTKPWEEIIEDRMLIHGINRRWKHVICEMLERVVNTPLNTENGKPLRLKQVAIQDRINEMEFHLPLRAVDAVTLERVFSGKGSTSFQGKLDGLVEQLAFSLSGGYLKGFIDLVFRHDGRYFIIDWKSNHLGDSFGNYHPDRLTDIMVSDYYFLQYHIYVLALDRYLRTNCRGYTYEKDFGGVFYCFIRGMGPSSGGASGIFFDCPDPDHVQRLNKKLLL